MRLHWVDFPKVRPVPRRGDQVRSDASFDR